MEHIKRLSRHLVLIICTSSLWIVAGVVIDISIVPSAYAQSCGGTQSQSQCLASGGVWNANTKTCTTPPPCQPQSCASGYAFNPTTCSCQQVYNPCANARAVLTGQYPFCVGGCVGCFEAYGCCYAEITYELRGQNGEYCGNGSYTVQPNCGVVETSSCMDMCNWTVCSTQTPFIILPR